MLELFFLVVLMMGLNAPPPEVIEQICHQAQPVCVYNAQGELEYCYPIDCPE